MLYAGWTLFVAGSITGNESQIFSQYGDKPNYTNMQQVSFDNAGENAFGGRVAYDFGAISGLSVGAWYTQGWGAINTSTNLGIPDRRELDLWIQYRPTEGPLKGFRLKTQYSNLWQQGNVRDTQPEFRFIVDYTVLFRPPPKS
jgi:outer membrane porin, OprD family